MAVSSTVEIVLRSLGWEGPVEEWSPGREVHLVALVADRRRVTRQFELAMQFLGGGWKVGFEQWQRYRTPYMTLCAHTPARMDHGHPIVMLSRTPLELMGAVDRSLLELGGQACIWQLLLSSPELDEVRRRVVQAASQQPVAGSA